MNFSFRLCASRRLLSGVLLSGALLGTAAYGQAPITLRIGAASNVLFGPVFVLADSSNGIASKHGLKIESRILFFFSRKSTKRPICASVCSVKPANTSCIRDINLRSSALRLAQSWIPDLQRKAFPQDCKRICRHPDSWGHGSLG